MGSSTSNPYVTDSLSGWSTNDQSSILVTNEDVSVVNSVLSENVRLFMTEGWSRNYSEAHQHDYLHKKRCTISLGNKP